MKILIDDLSATAIERIEARMRPGQFSVSGFLAQHESLVDVIQRDEAALAERSLAVQQVADRLESVIQQAYRLRDLRERKNTGGMIYMPDGSPMGVVEGRFEVAEEQFFGFQDCPFEDPDGKQCPYTAGTDYHVRCRETGEEFSFSEFALHLIRDHHFFEGEVPYRVDPLRVARFFGIEAGRSYAPEWKEESIWSECWMSTEKVLAIRPLPDVFAEVKSKAQHSFELNGDACLYFSEDLCLAEVHKPCVIDAGEIHGSVWTACQLKPGAYAFELKSNRYVSAAPLGEILSEPPLPPRPNDKAPLKEAIPNAQGIVRCPGCGIKIKVGTSSYRDGRHVSCGQKIQLIEPVDEASADPETLDRFPKELRARGFEAKRCLNEFNYMYVWQVTVPASSSDGSGSPVASVGRQRLLRMVPDRMSGEGHYGYSYESVREALEDIAARTNALRGTLPSCIVGTDCKVEDGWFQGMRRWFSTPVAVRYNLAPEKSSDQSWIDRLTELAGEVDELWKAHPDLPFSIRSSNIFIDDEQIRLVDQEKGWLDKLISDNFDGPYIMKKDPEGRAFEAVSADHPPIRQFAALWTYLRTGHSALAKEVRKDFSRLRELDMLPGMEDGVSFLDGADRDIIEQTLYGDELPYRSCLGLMQALKEAT